MSLFLLKDVIQNNKSVLNEAKKVEDIASAIKRNNSDIDKEELSELLMSGDPTSNDNGEHGKFVGKYWKWIAELFIKGSVSRNDSEHLNAAINTYNINKTVINRSIDSFNSLSELEEFLEANNYGNDFKQSRQVSKTDSEIETVYEDNIFVIKIPHTYEASRKLGGDTRWCTASSNRHYYDYYKGNYGGEYYVIINKINGKKYQMHPESHQFKNENDDDVCFNELSYSKKDTEGIINFFESKYVNTLEYTDGIYLEDFVYGLNNAQDKLAYIYESEYLDSVGNVSDNGNIFLVFNHMANLFNIHKNKFLFDEWFKVIDNHSRKYYMIKDSNGLYRVYNKDNEDFFIQNTFDFVSPITDGSLIVKKIGKYNALNFNKKGNKVEYIFDKWFDKIDYVFLIASLICVDNTGCYLYSIIFETYKKTEFDDIKNIGALFYAVYLNGKANAVPYKDISREDTLNYTILNEWYDDILYFRNMAFVVKNDGKYNLVSIESKKIIFNEWFDEYYGFEDEDFEGFVFSLNGKKVFVNSKFNIVPYIKYTSCDCVNPNEDIDNFDYNLKYYIISLDNKHNIVDGFFNLKLSEWYDEIKPILRYNEYNDEDYGYEEKADYVDGFILRKGNKKTYAPYNNDTFVTKNPFWFDDIEFYLKDGSDFEVFGLCVKNDNKYHIINRQSFVEFGDLDYAALLTDIGGIIPVAYIEKNNKFNYIIANKHNPIFKHWLDKSCLASEEKYSLFVINRSTYGLKYAMGKLYISYYSKEDEKYRYYEIKTFNELLFCEGVEYVNKNQIQEVIIRTLISYLA